MGRGRRLRPPLGEGEGLSERRGGVSKEVSGCTGIRGGGEFSRGGVHHAMSGWEGVCGGGAGAKISRTHPLRDVIFFGQISAKKKPEILSVHDLWEP